MKRGYAAGTGVSVPLTALLLMSALLAWAPTYAAAQSRAPTVAHAATQSPAAIHTSPAVHSSASAHAALGADPDRARISLSYRGALRGTLGLSLPLWSSRGSAAQPSTSPRDATHTADGIALDLTPMVELHEPPGSDQPLPNQFWRGLLSAGARYDLGSTGARYSVGLRVAHESDHETAHQFSSPGFLALNFVELPFGVNFALGALRLWLGARGRLYVLSCTRRAAPCRDLEGSSSVGGELGAVAHGATAWLWKLHPFASVSGAGIAGHGLLLAERRVLARAGFFMDVAHGVLDVHALGFFGHDVGITRGRSLTQLGAGIAWTLQLAN